MEQSGYDFTNLGDLHNEDIQDDPQQKLESSKDEQLQKLNGQAKLDAEKIKELEELIRKQKNEGGDGNENNGGNKNDSGKGQKYKGKEGSSQKQDPNQGQQDAAQKPKEDEDKPDDGSNTKQTSENEFEEKDIPKYEFKGQDKKFEDRFDRYVSIVKKKLRKGVAKIKHLDAIKTLNTVAPGNSMTADVFKFIKDVDERNDMGEED